MDGLNVAIAHWWLVAKQTGGTNEGTVAINMTLVGTTQRLCSQRSKGKEMTTTHRLCSRQSKGKQVL